VERLKPTRSLTWGRRKMVSDIMNSLNTDLEISKNGITLIVPAPILSQSI